MSNIETLAESKEKKNSVTTQDADQRLKELAANPDEAAARCAALQIISMLESEIERETRITEFKKLTGISIRAIRAEVEKLLTKKPLIQKDDQLAARHTSFYCNGVMLLEQIYNSGKNMFLIYNTETGEMQKTPVLETEEGIVEPYGGEDVNLGAVILPTDTEEYGSTLDLLADIESHVYRYLDVSGSYLKFTAYYILLSWLFDRFSTLPYLRALGDIGTGKSRFLDVIGGLCYKAIRASGCITPAPIYRMIRKWGGTLILDEADMKNSDEYNEVVTILNCGFEKGRPVLRALKDNPDKIQVLPVFSPKVFATRRRFKDVALEARCLTEVMNETSRTDIPPVLGKNFHAEQQHLRNRLLLFRLRNYFKVDPERGANVSLGDIEPRLRQISESFISLFAADPQALERYKQFISGHQKELIEQRADTRTGHVVEALFKLISGNILGNMVTAVTTTTGDNIGLFNITPRDIGDRAEMSPQAVGQILKSLGITTKLAKIKGVTKRWVVCDALKLEKIKKRYIAEEDIAEEIPLSTVSLVTNVTYVTETEPQQEKWTEIEDSEKLPFN